MFLNITLFTDKQFNIPEYGTTMDVHTL